MSIKQCHYEIEIDGGKLSFNSELELNDYLYKNLHTMSFKGDKAIYSLKGEETKNKLLNTKPTFKIIEINVRNGCRI
jgi:hypothetical protein